MLHQWLHLSKGLAAAMGALLGMLALLGLFGPVPLFHALTELSCVVLGLGGFVMLANARRYVLDPALYAIGSSLLFSGVLNLLHLLASPGMALLPFGAPSQLWVAAGGVLVLAALATPFLPARGPGFLAVVLFFAAASAMGAAFILRLGNLPDFAEAPTPFARTIALIYAASLSGGLLLLNRNRFPPQVQRPLQAFLALTAGSYLLFALPEPGAAFHVAAHLAKVAAFACAYAAFNYCGFENPLSTLLDSLKQREEELAERGARLLKQSQAIVDLTKHPALSSGDMRQAGQLLARTAVRFLGGGKAALLMANAAGTGMTVMDVCDATVCEPWKSRPILVQEHPRLFEALSSGRTVAAQAGVDSLFGPLVREAFGLEASPAVMVAGIRRRGRTAGIICHAAIQEPAEEAIDRQLFLASLADLAAMTLEIHERNLEKIAREESEERLAALIHALPDQVCFKDQRGRWLVANRSWLSAHNIDRQDYKGFTGSKPDSEDDLDGLPTGLRLKTDAAAWTLGRIDYCTFIRSRNGEKALEVMKMAIGPPRQPRGLMILARDVTSHRQALEEARATNAELRAIYGEMLDGLVVLDPGMQQIVRANPAFTRMFGYALDELPGLNWRELLAPGHWEAVLPLLSSFGSGGTAALEDIHCRRKNGDLFWVDASIARFEHEGRPAVLIMARDVTRRKLDAQALEARNRQIQAFNETLEARVRAATDENRRKDALLIQQSRLAAMGEMIGNIAHQWRQPLNALGLLVANLVMDAKDGSLGEKEAEQYQKQCRDILMVMSRTIDDFRNFFKADKAKQTFPLAEPVGEALSLVEASLAQHGITIAKDLAEAPPVTGFKGEISQVILNLLVNARDAIAASGRRRGRITVRSYSSDGEARVDVADDGGGVPPEAASRIFNPYFTTKAKDKGTGLGLYMSRMIIEDHMNGRISFVNSAEGAVFTVALPLAEPVEPGAGDGTPRP